MTICSFSYAHSTTNKEYPSPFLKKWPVKMFHSLNSRAEVSCVSFELSLASCDYLSFTTRPSRTIYRSKSYEKQLIHTQTQVRQLSFFFIVFNPRLICLGIKWNKMSEFRNALKSKNCFKYNLKIQPLREREGYHWRLYKKLRHKPD